VIIAAFSTLGKTTYVKQHPGTNLDFEVSKLSKASGFSGWDDTTPDAKAKLAGLAFEADIRYYENVFVTRPEILTYLPKGACAIVLTPKFGVDEFAKRLMKRGKPLEEMEEWRILGGSNYVPAIRRYQDIQHQCKEKHINVVSLEVDYVSDLFKQGSQNFQVKSVKRGGSKPEGGKNG
jgi:deoxyadenosine/deoxycytidine kinase